MTTFLLHKAVPPETHTVPAYDRNGLKMVYSGYNFAKARRYAQTRVEGTYPDFLVQRFRTGKESMAWLIHTKAGVVLYTLIKGD